MARPAGKHRCRGITPDRRLYIGNQRSESVEETITLCCYLNKIAHPDSFSRRFAMLPDSQDERQNERDRQWAERIRASGVRHWRSSDAYAGARFVFAAKHGGEEVGKEGQGTTALLDFH